MCFSQLKFTSPKNCLTTFEVFFTCVTLRRASIVIFDSVMSIKTLFNFYSNSWSIIFKELEEYATIFFRENFEHKKIQYFFFSIELVITVYLHSMKFAHQLGTNKERYDPSRKTWISCGENHWWDGKIIVYCYLDDWKFHLKES